MSQALVWLGSAGRRESGAACVEKETLFIGSWMSFLAASRI